MVNPEPKELLSKAIQQSIAGADFNWELFYKHWYRDLGTPLFFLFKKNLSVTNTQYAELFSLIANHVAANDGKVPKLLFYTTEHIKGSLSEAITTLLEGYSSNDSDRIQQFVDRYVEVFTSTISVDMFFGSCAVFLPPGIQVNLDQIVADSGYIHSAGYSIFIRNIRKAKKGDFLHGLSSYLTSISSTEKIPFIIYSHEDFSGFDKIASELIDRGIEQCKIFIDKMSMGSERLSTIVSEMQDDKRFKDKLIIPSPGNYQEQHLFKTGRTIWLISDRSISGGSIGNPGTNRYYICYEQLVKNESPFFFFDENKPAWKSHTTLPHSLTSALLNIARPIAKGGVICDPFAGTGTTWMEVKRLGLNNDVICSDLSAIATTLLEDNMEFFCLSTADLKELHKNLEMCTPSGEANQIRIEFDDYRTIGPYQKVKELLAALKKEQRDEKHEFELSEQFVEQLLALPFLTRIIFYIGLRAELRYQGSFERKSLTFEEAFKKSKDKLLDQIQMFIELKEEVLADDARIEGPLFHKSIATYSYKLTPSIVFQDIKNFAKEISTGMISMRDACALTRNSVDLIICDPPYGFNTAEDNSQLASLYDKFLDAAIDGLKSKGQLIICLPAESYTGRDLPFCTRSDLVSRQILVKAHKKNRLVYRRADSLPYSWLAPPYYWESERALKRTILHFRFI
ncbi:MAG TPA: hypothetical protein VFE50_09560 [Cyclobacteriaceae bacterium]|nr:hypothetical protein [Cyclobacteriaceae bacterium]